MAIKVTESEAVESTYPRLVKGAELDSPLVVYLTGEGLGFVIRKDDSYDAGDSLKNWAKDMPDYTGTITLENIK